MTTLRWNFAFVILSFFGLAMTSTTIAQQTPAVSKTRIGTFDSRCIAIAYYRSDDFKKKMEKLHSQHQKLISEDNQEQAKKMEAEGIALQALVHKQSFGIWPIDPILKKIKPQLADIAVDAEVDLIVSKWAIAYQRPNMEFTNITDRMVKSFNPTAATLKIIQDIQKQTPVPIETLENHQD